MKNKFTSVCAFLLVLVIPLFFNQAKATPLNATITSVIYPLCNGGCGTATVRATGGTSPYTYNWTPNGGTNASGTCLTAGTYTVVVTDALSNTASASVTITQPTLLVANPSGTWPFCNGGSNGSVNANANGGTSPYTYLWQPIGKTGATVSGLTAGCYSVVVQDDNGCQVTASICLSQPPPVTATISNVIYPLCNGQCGSAKVTGGGGYAPYTYSWTPSGGTGSTATCLTAGNYTVTVTDNAGCTATASVSITQPAVVVLNPTITKNIPCNGGTACAAGNASGGTSPYTYLWLPGGLTGDTICGLTAGTYTVHVQDDNGCTASATISITQPIIFSAIATGANNTQCVNPNGMAAVTQTGGTGPYTYLWTPTNQTLNHATGLAAGTYTCTVTDNNGCTATVSVHIGGTAAPILTLSSTMSISNHCTGTATASVTGGVPPYTYKWWPGNQTTATINNLCQGYYCCRVTDSAGCSDSSCVTIDTVRATGVNSPTNELVNVNVYPNPSNGKFTVAYSLGFDDNVKIIVFNELGQEVYMEQKHINAGSNTEQLNIENLASGIYSLLLETSNNSIVHKLLIMRNK